MLIRDIPFSDGFPYLPIKIVNPQTYQSVKVLGSVDTGASACAFPGYIAGLLGHNPLRGAKSHSSSAGGAAESYAHTTTIEI